MLQLFKEIKEELYLHIFPFWNQLLDREEGGFYGEISSDLILNKKADKGSLSCSRLLWSYSRMFNYSKNPSYLEYAHHAYKFLSKKLYDHENGGYYWLVDFKGNLVDDRKHICAQSYIIYALSEYYIAVQKREVKELVYALFSIIEEKAYDLKRNGYKEEFTKNWLEKENELLAENGIDFTFSLNTHLHLIEAYTTLYKIDSDPKVKEALLKLLSIISNKIYDAKNKNMQLFFDEKWINKAAIYSYGHDIEASWLLQETVDVLGIQDERIETIIRQLEIPISKTAILPDGSIIKESRDNLIDESRVWWAQCEALIAYMNLYQKTQKVDYKNRVINLWKFIKEHIIDPRKGGEWHAELDSNLQAKKHSVAQLWKTPYHNARSCIELLERIKKVSDFSDTF